MDAQDIFDLAQDHFALGQQAFQRGDQNAFDAHAREHHILSASYIAVATAALNEQSKKEG